MKCYEDVFEIQQIMTRYSIAMDSAELHFLESCFVPEAMLDIGGVGFVTVDAYRTICAVALERLDATQHQLGLPAIRVDGDRAWSRCTFVAQHVRNDLAPDNVFTIGGFYDDELVRTPEGWRISRRAGVPIWSTGNPDVIPGFPATIERVPRHRAPRWLV